MPGDKLSTAESLRATRTFGQVRCHNPSCTARITPEAGTDTVTCERCGSKWRIFWIKPGFPRIRGPVWETSRKLASDQMAKIAGRKEGE